MPVQGCPEFVVALLQLFKSHIEQFGTGKAQKGATGGSTTGRRQIFGKRDAAALQCIITGEYLHKVRCFRQSPYMNKIFRGF